MIRYVPTPAPTTNTLAKIIQPFFDISVILNVYPFFSNIPFLYAKYPSPPTATTPSVTHSHVNFFLGGGV